MILIIVSHWIHFIDKIQNQLSESWLDEFRLLFVLALLNRWIHQVHIPISDAAVFLYLIFIASYHALERREACKGGKEATRRAAATQQSGKSSSSSAAPRPSSSNGTRKHEPPSSNAGNHHSSRAPSSKQTKPAPAAAAAAYDEKVVASLDTLISWITPKSLRGSLTRFPYHTDYRTETLHRQFGKRERLLLL